MKRRALLWVGAMVATAFACSPDAADVVGTWRNKTQQLMVVKGDLNGTVVQEKSCTPVLDVSIHRDPYDSFAIQFVDNQYIFFPLAQTEEFAPSEYFCSSKDSVPMCQFCRIEGNNMECSTTEQKITGRGSTVTHDCEWTRVTGTSTVTTPDAGIRCPAMPDAGGAGCRAAIPVATDSGFIPDSGDFRDAGVGD